MTHGTRALRILLSAALLTALGCDDDGALELSVDLRTDFVAGAEFSGLRLELVGEGVTETDVAEPVSYVAGRRFFDLDGLAANERRTIALSLLSPTSEVVARREVIVDQSGDLAVTVVMTRDCASVSCPNEPGDSATSCLGGRCVDPRCVEGDEEVCLDPLCESDAECMPMNACAAPVCNLGICLYEGLDACEEGTYCDPSRGCVAIPGMDGGPAGPATPVLFYPPQGANTGTVHVAASASVTFRWEASEDPERFELEVDQDCPIAGYADCAFPSPAISPTIPGDQRAYTAELTVRTAPPVGTRFVYRLRACDGTECSAWTRPRHVAVGRLGNDFDGDGYDEVAIGATHLVHVASGGSRTLSTREIANPFADDTSGFGRTLAAGDIDGDGFTDLAVGAPFDRGYGSVAIYRGGASGLSLWTLVQGPDAIGLNAAFGREVCIGDFDGDGYGDVLTDTLDDGGFVIRGEGETLAEPASVTIDGRIYDCVDVDFDGYTDVVLGDGYQRGGPDGLEPMVFERASMAYGLGDLGGDGRPEYGSVGRDTFEVYWSEPGAVLGTARAVSGSLFAIDWQVHSIATDIDGDGIGDVAVGDSGASSGDAGSAAIISGAATPDGSRYLELPTCPSCRYGSAVSSGLDVDGDGNADFAIGGPDGALVDVFFGGGSSDPPPSTRLTGGPGFGVGL